MRSLATPGRLNACPTKAVNRWGALVAQAVSPAIPTVADFCHGLLGLILVTVLTAAASGLGVKTQLVGGTPAGVAAKSTAFLDYTGPTELVFHCGAVDLRVPYEKVNTLEYGQTVSRRYAAAMLISPVLLLSKSRKHFVTLGYVDSDGKQQALVFRVEKGDIRSVLVGLEARTGRRVEYQDDEARKAGKG